MKNKGFTLIELLVTIAILGIITGLSIPLIRNIQLKNIDRKYTIYGASVLQTAKLYNDAYYKDMFGNEPTGCAIVSYEKLENKQNLKDIDMPEVSCNSTTTQVMIKKLGNQYAYRWKIGCGKEVNGKTETVTIIYPKEEKNSPFECTGNGDAKMNIIATPDYNRGYKVKGETVKFYISSSTGISTDSSLSYTWSTNQNPTTLTDLKKLELRINPTNKKQIKQILSGELSQVSTKTNIETPKNLNGAYYLIIKVNKLTDALGSSWTKTTNPEDSILSFGPFELDNKEPIISNIEVKSINNQFNSNQVKVKFKAEDNYSKNNEIKVCVSTTDNCSNYVSYDTYDFNKNIKLADTFNGQVKKVYIYAKDKAGNTTKKEASYTIYKECTKTKDGSSWVDSTACSKKCGGGTKIQKKTLVDAYTNKTCSGVSNTTQTVSCNTMGCCSKTTTTYGNWSKWSACSKKCGGGTQTRSRTITYKSAYDGSVCSTKKETASQKCNTMTCCSKTKTSCGSYGSCSKKCGGGTKKRTCTKKSAYDGSKCSSYTDSSSCNTQGCCSSTTTKCGSYGSCSKKCGGGTKKRTCTKYSSYTGSKCSSYTDSAKCNTMGCCSSTSSSCTSKCTKAKTNRKNCYKTYRKTCKYYSRYNGQHCKTTTTTSQKTITGWATCYC